jgi:hypothetical protein
MLDRTFVGERIKFEGRPCAERRSFEISVFQAIGKGRTIRCVSELTGLRPLGPVTELRPLARPLGRLLRNFAHASLVEFPFIPRH